MKLEEQHKTYTHKMENIEYNRRVNLDKVTTHNLDKILHKKIRSATKMRVPGKAEIYEQLQDKYKMSWKSPGFVNN